MNNEFENSSDSLHSLNIEYLENEGFVAFDESGRKLFTIFPYDNGPDYTSEGLFRIIENNKIGYANEQGEIVITPQFDAALPFQNGFAAFCEGCNTEKDDEHFVWTDGKWGFINCKGQVIVPPVYNKLISDFSAGFATVERDGNVFNIDKNGNELKIPKKNYREWIRLLTEAVRLAYKITFNDRLILDINFKPNYSMYNFYNDDPDVVQITVRLEEGKFPIINYLLIPWQSFALTQTDNLSISPVALLDILTVTDYAVVYYSGIFLPGNDSNYQYAVDFDNIFKDLVNYKENQNPEELESLNIPEGIQLISYEVYPNYISLQTAIPGSKMVEFSEWEKVSDDRMLYLRQIPDIGQKQQNWFMPLKSFTDTYYLSVQEDLFRIFSNALNESMLNPAERYNIYTSAKSKMRELFNAANSFVNFLYDKYENRLARWLNVAVEKNVIPTVENIFGDYQPKLTPDTVIDYMPSIHDEFVNLPSPDLENLSELLTLFKKYKEKSISDPGQWVEGNIILGANPQEYQASKAELLLAEAGKLIQYVLENNTTDDIEKNIAAFDMTDFNPVYKEFSFIHYDVMGSGRFFYIHGIEDKKLELP